MANIKEFFGYRFDKTNFNNLSDAMAVAYDRMTEEEREIIIKYRVMSDENKEQIKKQVDELK